MKPKAFCLVGGDRPFGPKAAICIQSIRDYYPDTPIYLFVPDEEVQVPNIDVDNVSIITTSVEIPEYPISTKVQALAIAEAETDQRPIWLLDTDTLLLDSLPDVTADIAVKPVDWSKQYWATDEPEKWSQVYNMLGLSVPSETMTTSVDGKSVLPYFNAGVVASNLSSLGKEWLNLTKELYGTLPDPMHTDQVALAALTSECEREHLTERDNYPLNLRLRVSSDARVIHYHDSQNLLKAPRVCRQDDLIREHINFWYTNIQFPFFCAKELLQWAKRQSRI